MELSIKTQKKAGIFEKMGDWWNENIVESISSIILKFKNIFRRRINDVITNQEKNLEKFQINETDFMKLSDTVEQIFEQGIIDPSIKKNLRIRTHDSQNTYILTESEHFSIDEVVVTKLDKKFGTFNVYQIKKNKSEKENYYAANGGYNDPNIEKTASGNDKYDTHGHFWDRGYWPDQKLNVINIPPFSGFVQTNRYPEYDYATDYLTHELAHAEQFVMLSGRKEIDPMQAGPIKDLLAMIKNSDQLNPKAKKFLTEKTDNWVLNELYAMNADLYAKEKFGKSVRIKKEKAKLWKKIGEATAINNFDWIDDQHSKGQILAHLLRDSMPEFMERKNFLKQFWTEN
jgi:hypothetical protein